MKYLIPHMKYLLPLLIAAIFTGCATTQNKNFKEYKYVTVTDEVIPTENKETPFIKSVTRWPIQSAKVSKQMSQEGWTLIDVEPIENLADNGRTVGINDERTLLLVFGR